MQRFEEWIPARRIRDERRHRLAAALIAVLIAFALAFGVATFAHGAEREATCWLGGCSGVCVDASGLVLTVKHCEFPETVDVEFRSIGKTYQAKKVYTGSYDDDVMAFQLPSGHYPAATVAGAAPKRGEVVYTFGFPSGKFEALTGTVLGTSTYTDGTPVISTTIPARGGHSGGPLFNLQGEVVGLCSTSITAKAPKRVEVAGDSCWIATGRLGLAILTAQVNQRPPLSAPGAVPAPVKPRRLYVFTALWCGSCQTYHSDYARNIGELQDFLQAQGVERTKSGKHYGAVESVPLGWDQPEIARACEVATGSKPRLLPTFWIDGAKEVLSGYSGPEKLKAYVTAQLAAAAPPAPPIEQVPFKREGETPPVEEFPKPVEPLVSPTPDPAEQWADVKAVVLVAKQDRGIVYGAGARLALEQASVAIRRKIQETTKGHADVELVTERLSPERFAAVEKAVGISVDKLHVVVMVRKQDLGGIRAKAVEMVEGALAGLTERSEHVPIDFVAERTNPELYAAIAASLNSTDAAGDELPDQSWWMSAAAAFVGLLKRRFLNREAA